MPSQQSPRLVSVLILVLTAGAAPLAHAAEPASPIRSVLHDYGAALPHVQPRHLAVEPNENDRPHPLDQDVRGPLRVARQAEASVAAGHMLKASGKYQEILDSPDVSLLLPAGGDVHLPVWQYCMTRILTGPSDLLRSYRSSYEAPARNMLATAQAARETDALWNVVHRYGATEAAGDALDTLAAVQLERGNALAAVHALEMRLATGLPSDRAMPRLLAKLAVALARAGQRARLTTLATAARTHAPDLSIETEGKTVGLPQFADALLASLPQDAEPLEAGPAPRPATLLWQVPVAPVPAQRSQPRGRTQPISMRLASFGPLVHDGIVYCQTSNEVRAISLATGRELNAVSLGGPQFAQPPARAGSGQPARGTGIITPALHRGATGPALVVASPVAYMQKANRFGRAIIRASSLAALAPPTARHDGRVLWTLSTLSTTDSEDTVRFVSSPAVAHGVVAIGARQSQNETRAFLLGYDAATGRRLWRTHVATGNWVNPARALGHAPDGAPPALRDRLAYYCSDQGTVAAVDLANGSVRWLAQYAQNSPTECRLRTIGGEETSITAPPNRPILAGRTLFALPADSKHLIALDAATGTEKWRRPRTVGDAVGLFLLAADSERVIVSGSAVVCFDARTGALLWRSVLLDSFPAGRGVLAGDHVMVPLEGSVAMIDIQATGRLAEPVGWRRWRRNRAGSGNLTLLDGRLLVARDDSLSLFAGVNWGDIIRARIKRAPEQPKHHADLGVMYAGARHWPSAADALEKARALQLAQGKPDAAVDALLADAYRQVATAFEDAGRWGEAAKVLTKAIALDDKRAAGTALLLLRRARAQAKADDPRAALRTLDVVIEQFGGVRVRMPDGLFPQMNGVTIAANVPAALQIASLVKKHGAAVYADQERAAEAAAADRPPSDVIQRWPNSSHAAGLRLAQAEKAIHEQRFGAASLTLLEVQRLCHASDAGRIAKLTSELAAAKALQHRQPAPVKPGTSPKILWHTPVKSTAACTESVADLPARALGQYTGERLLLANGKSLSAHDLADGKLLWETGTGWLGVRYQAPTSAQAGAQRAALEVLEALPNEPADKAGVKAGDLLLSFGGQPIRQRNDLVQLCATTQPGTKVKLEILRDRRRLTIEVEIGQRPTALAGTRTQLSRTAPQEFIRVVGVEGEHIIADVDLALLWINRKTGRVERKSIIAPYTNQMALFRLHNRYAASLRRYQQLRRRGGRPIIADGGIVAPTPQGTVECLDRSGRRRWSVSMASLNGDDTADPERVPTIYQVVALPGRIAVVTAIIGQATIEPEPKLTVFDAFSGVTLLRKPLPLAPHLDRYRLIALGERLVVSVPPLPGRHRGALVAYDLPAEEPAWATAIPEAGDAPRLPSQAAHTPVLASGKFLIPASQSRLAAVDAASGKLAWQRQLPGAIRHLVPAKDRAFVVYARPALGRRPTCAVACVRMADGELLWNKTLFGRTYPRPSDAVAFARVSAGRLVLVLNLNNQRGIYIGWPVVAVLGTDDGALVGTIGMAGVRRYNVRGGRWGYVGRLKDGVIGLIGDTGLIGISFDK